MTPTKIIEIVCKDYELAVEKFDLPTRRREIVEPCQVSHYFIREYYPRMSYRAIGEIAGHKNHATVQHSIKTIRNLIKTDRFISMRIKSIKFEIDMEMRRQEHKLSMSTYTERKELILTI